MEINLNQLTPIKVRKSSTKGITINSSGMYITKELAEFYGIDKYKHVVFFEYTKSTIVLLGFNSIDTVPHTLRQYMTEFQASYDKDKNIRAYKLHSVELVKKYGKAIKIEIEPVTISGYNGYLLNVTLPIESILSL